MSDADHDHDTIEHEPEHADATVDTVEALVDETASGGVADEPVRRKRPVDKGLLAACFVIACGLFAIIWGVTSAVTGNDGIDRPEAIEDLSPVENAKQVFQQEQIRVDLQAGYEAILIVDGIELETNPIAPVAVDPESNGQQVSIPPTAVFDPGNAVITFRPSDDAVITSFREGRHTAQVVYWRVEEGRDSAVSYRWSFDVV